MDNTSGNPNPPVPLRTPPADSLAAKLFEPSGPPQPVTSDDEVLNLIAAGGVFLVALGGLLLPVVGSMGHTAGATRSAKVEWEYRQQQIEQAIQAEQAATPDREQQRRPMNSDKHDR